MPVTIPLAESVVATPVFPLRQYPAGLGSLNAIVIPIHTFEGPDIAGGNAFTVTIAVVTQPVGSV